METSPIVERFEHELNSLFVRISPSFTGTPPTEKKTERERIPAVAKFAGEKKSSVKSSAL